MLNPVFIHRSRSLFVGAVLTVSMLLSRRVSLRPAWTRDLPAYVMGSLATFWCLERLAPIVSSLGAASGWL